MSRHVILLTDAHEAPAYELIEALRLAGVTTLIEGIREVRSSVQSRRYGREETNKALDSQPIAVLYEVVVGADMVELHTAVEHATTSWPDIPLIACRKQSNAFLGLSLRNIDGVTLKRLGFRAIADKAAQLPAILHEIEGHGMTGELKLPDAVKMPVDRGSFSLPFRMKTSGLRAAATLLRTA
jgi:hypothetical protein